MIRSVDGVSLRSPSASQRTILEDAINELLHSEQW